MKNLKKLSWQIPFLLFLVLGTYYTLTQKSGGPVQWKEEGNINGISYSISCRGSIHQQNALNAELEKIRQGADRALQNDSTHSIHPDTVSARIYHMIVTFMEKEQISDFQLEVGSYKSDSLR